MFYKLEKILDDKGSRREFICYVRAKNKKAAYKRLKMKHSLGFYPLTELSKKEAKKVVKELEKEAEYLLMEHKIFLNQTKDLKKGKLLKYAKNRVCVLKAQMKSVKEQTDLII
jgi:thioester reductase-like protein